MTDTLPPRALAGGDGLGKGGVAVRPVKPVAFKVNPVSGAHLILVDIVGAKAFRYAQIGVHRPLAVRSDQNHATAGFLGIGHRTRGFINRALRLNIMGEDVAKLIVAHLADIGGGTTKRGDSGNRVGGGAARDFLGRAHVGIKLAGAFNIDELHDALLNTIVLEKGIVDMGEHIDNRIADANHGKRLAHMILSLDVQRSAMIQLVQTGLRALQM